VRKVGFIMKKLLWPVAAFLSLLTVSLAHAGAARAVSADDAQSAVIQGTHVVDVRAAAAFAQGHVPMATSMPSDTANLPLPQLAQLFSQAGVDTSRTVLVMGDAGDANAHALWQRLTQVTSGRVLWLVGGVQEWQMRGHALTTQVVARYPVPQFLSSFETPSTSTRMAGSRVRTSAILERDLPVVLSLN
jgi:3-mercaptopyruvate sulfurtransferase SseA